MIINVAPKLISLCLSLIMSSSFFTNLLHSRGVCLFYKGGGGASRGVFFQLLHMETGFLLPNLHSEFVHLKSPGMQFMNHFNDFKNP